MDDDYPYTSDIAERKWLETELTKRCQYDQIELCGFRRHPEDKDAYYKKINVQNQIKTILIYFKQASLTDDVELNTVKRKQTQIAHSRKVQKAYLNSLKKDDINIYFGHARFGSGPGFLPIKNFSTTWTKTYLLRPFLSEMKSVFESAKQKPKLIGMINCDGQEHYGRFLSKYAPDSALFLTRQTMSADDALRTMYVGLNSLLTQTCEDEFKEQMLSTITTVFYDKTEGKPKDISEKTPTLFNFFKKEKVDGDFYWLWMLKYFLGEEKEIPVSDIH